MYVCMYVCMSVCMPREQNCTFVYAIRTISTVNKERFAGLNFCGFHPMKFSQENFCSALYLQMTLYEACKYSWENFHGALENRRSLAQRIFPHLRYAIFIVTHFYVCKSFTNSTMS